MLLIFQSAIQPRYRYKDSKALQWSFDWDFCRLFFTGVRMCAFKISSFTYLTLKSGKITLRMQSLCKILPLNTKRCPYCTCKVQNTKLKLSPQNICFQAFLPGKNHCNTTVNKFTTTQFQMFGSGGLCEW